MAFLLIVDFHQIQPSMQLPPELSSTKGYRTPINTYFFIDPTFVYSLFPLEKPMFIQMIKAFRECVQSKIALIRVSLVNLDWEVARQTAHGIKPMGSYIGANEMKPMVDQLETAIREQNMLQATSLVIELDALCKSIIHEIDFFVDHEIIEN